MLLKTLKNFGSLARFALQHGVRVLLADEMGLGKTLQANDMHELFSLPLFTDCPK